MLHNYIQMSGKKIIDLTMPLSNETSGVCIHSSKTLIKDGWNASTYQLYSHSGTHMDAPIHFDVNTQTIDQIPVNRFISEAWVVSITNLEPKAWIKIAHLKDVAEKVQAGQSILLRTDWSKKVNTYAFRDQLPRISEELAHWCGDKKINIIGVEPPSVADVNNLEEVTKIHQILLGNDIIIIEGLPVVHLGDVDFNVVDISVKEEPVDVLYHCECCDFG